MHQCGPTRFPLATTCFSTVGSAPSLVSLHHYFFLHYHLFLPIDTRTGPSLYRRVLYYKFQNSINQLTRYTVPTVQRGVGTESAALARQTRRSAATSSAPQSSCNPQRANIGVDTCPRKRPPPPISVATVQPRWFRSRRLLDFSTAWCSIHTIVFRSLQLYLPTPSGISIFTRIPVTKILKRGSCRRCLFLAIDPILDALSINNLVL